MQREEKAEGWMSCFPNHPIFLTDDKISIVTSTESSEAVQSPKLLTTIINQSDLVVACGQELRFTSMAKFKSHNNSQNQDDQIASYKILKPSRSTSFPRGPITQLVANPSSQLLAVCSDYQVSVIALPRLDEHPDSTSHLICDALSVGDFDLLEDLNSSTESDTNRVVKVLWHEMSYRASTLLVLYSNGRVHEFDITKDSKQPTQVLDFTSHLGILPTTLNRQDDDEESGYPESLSPRVRRMTRSSSNIFNTPNRRRAGPTHHVHNTPRSQRESSVRCDSYVSDYPEKNRQDGTFSAFDHSATKAVTMCFGSGVGDWGPMTLYGLMQNGDLYAICPYLPRNASVNLCYFDVVL